jgi:hypothetical protein
VRSAALRPRDRLSRLMANVQQLFSSFRLPALMAWGVTIGGRLLRVLGRLLPTSPPHFGCSACVAGAADAGEWERARPRERGAALAVAAALPSWCVLNLAGPSLRLISRIAGRGRDELLRARHLIAAGGGGGRRAGQEAGEVERVAAALGVLVARAEAEKGEAPRLAVVVLPAAGASVCADAWAAAVPSFLQDAE